MAVKQRPEWSVVDIAAHAMDATSLSQLTLPEVKRMASRILNDQGKAPEPNRTDPKPSRASGVLKAIGKDVVKP